MKLISYTVDLSFTNTPRVDARVLLTDSATGESKQETLQFFDDDARAIVEMVPNPSPGGTGLVAHPEGRIDPAKLSAAIAARIIEVNGPPEALAARVAAAEDARRVQREAQAAAIEAEAKRTAAEAEVAAKRAELAEIEKQIAMKRSAKPA